MAPIASEAAPLVAPSSSKGVGASPAVTSAATTLAATTSPAELVASIERVHAQRDAWYNLALEEKVAMLKRLRVRLSAVVEEFAHASGVDVRHIETTNPNYGVAYVIGAGSSGVAIAKLIESYETLIKTGAFAKPCGTRTDDAGRTFVCIGPNGLLDSILCGPGSKVELEIARNEPVTQGKAFAASKPLVCGVLGAGNFEAITDTLHQLYMERHVVVYKANPVNDACAPVLAKIFEEYIERGFVSIVRGGVDVGSALTQHALVEELMLTGSDKTFNAIVWGVGAEAAANRASGTPKCSKRVCAELGNCSPWIVTPSNYCDAELDHQAAQLAVIKTINSGHICVSPQLVVVDKNWPQRAKFMDLVERHLSKMCMAPLYYPGTERNRDAFEAAYKSKARRVASVDGSNYVVVIRDVDAASDESAYARSNEAFSPVLVELVVDYAGANVDVNKFLFNVPSFCNDHLWGTLAATIIAKDNVDEAALRKAVAELKYGTIGVNAWGGAGAQNPSFPWGGYPGHTREDVQSGIGQMNNYAQFDNVTKGILWTKCISTVHSMPPHVNPKAQLALPRFTYYACNPTTWNLMKLLSAAILGL